MQVSDLRARPYVNPLFLYYAELKGIKDAVIEHPKNLKLPLDSYFTLELTVFLNGNHYTVTLYGDDDGYESVEVKLKVDK